MIHSQCSPNYTNTETLSGCIVGVKKAVGQKCGRCWFFDENIGKVGVSRYDLCQRCDDAIIVWERQSGTKFASTVCT
jgi:hypothetical protein